MDAAFTSVSVFQAEPSQVVKFAVWSDGTAMSSSTNTSILCDPSSGPRYLGRTRRIQGHAPFFPFFLHGKRYNANWLQRVDAPSFMCRGPVQIVHSIIRIANHRLVRRSTFDFGGILINAIERFLAHEHSVNNI